MNQEIVDLIVPMDTEEEIIKGDMNKGNGDHAGFDEIIGHIEDLLMESEFQEIQNKFLENYWHIFEPEEENKLIYMEIFNQYNQEIESYIVKQLKKTVPNFSIDILMDQLNKRRPELDGEVFEVLATLTDFLSFKEMLLDYKAVKEGKVEDFSGGISITSMKSTSSESDGPIS